MQNNQLIQTSQSANMVSDSISFGLSRNQFNEISTLVYQLCGIDLHAGKETLVRSRLAKRLRALSIAGFDQYLEYLRNDKSMQEITAMVDSLTTNKTSFFRESQHFDYLKNFLIPNLKSQKRDIRIWSAGCSTGEEPYTIAVVLLESIPDIERYNPRILATDISSRVLDAAREGTYRQDVIKDIPSDSLSKYFTCTKSQTISDYKVKDKVKSMVRFARLNLMSEWPMKGSFDIIFCRNVMIYFDKPTQQKLVQRFGNMLAPSGHLFVGHSESLTKISHDLRYVQPAVYIK